MKAVSFPEETHVLAKDQPQYQPLPVWTDGQAVVSCWSLSFWERLRMLVTGRVWLTQMTFGQLLQPQLPSLDNPIPGLIAERLLHPIDPTVDDDYHTTDG